MKKVLMGFDRLMRSYLPDPFVIAVILTYIVFVIAAAFTESSVMDVSIYWGSGLWDLLTFMTQMALILLGGYVVAVSRPVKQGLVRLAALPKSSSQVILLTFLISSVACWLNWGLGLVVSAFVALEMAKVHKNVSFRLLVATSYTGFIFWHGGLSGSIPLVVSTPDNFSQQWIGRLIPISETLFSQINLVIVFGLLSILGAITVFLGQKADNDAVVILDEESEDEKDELITASEKMDHSKMVNFVVLTLGASYIYASLFRNEFSFNLNMVNLILILLGLLLHSSPKSFLKAVNEGSQKLGPILVQYPLYAGIMGIIVKSGLASDVSQFFVSISNEKTYSVFTFLSAGLVNFFVPSGGGQWAVQAPIVIQGARELGVPLSKAVMAVAWGDAWTNLAQPFWALPLLSIAGLGAKDIMGYCFVALVASGVYISSVFLLL